MTKLSSSSKYLLFAIIGLVLVAILLGSYKFLSNSASPIPQSPTTWKTYTNPIYKYELKYPENIFPFATDNMLDVQYWSNKKETKPPLRGNDPNRIILIMDVSNTENVSTNSIQYYKNTIEFDSESASEELGMVKISSINTSGIKGATYLKTIPSNGRTMPPYSYLAVWYKDGKYYELWLSAASEDKIKNQKQLFDQILSTFTFLSNNEEVNLKTQCTQEGGKWLEDYNECEGNVSQNWCIENGGEYDNCASACRNNPEYPNVPCIKMCVFVCSFK